MSMDADADYSGSEVSEGGSDGGASTETSDANTALSEVSEASDANTALSDAGDGADTPMSESAPETTVSESTTEATETPPADNTEAKDAANTELTEHTDAENTPMQDNAESTSATEDAEHAAETDAGLTDAEKSDLKSETGWSDEVVDAIKSKDEAELYKEAGLRDEKVDGRSCLVRDDIDMDQRDYRGRTNQERIAQHLSPINRDGEVVELHHVGQKQDSPFAELTTGQHRQDGHYKILHDTTKESEIDRTAYATEKARHWEARARQ